MASAKPDNCREVEPRRSASRRNLGTRVVHTYESRLTHQSGAKPHSANLSHLPICQKLPCTATAAFKTEKNFADQNGGCRAGKFGEMREVWRGKRPLRKGALPPPRSSSPLHEPLCRDEGVAEKHRDGHRTDAARDGRDEGAERGNRGEVHVTH